MTRVLTRKPKKEVSRAAYPDIKTRFVEYLYREVSVGTQTKVVRAARVARGQVAEIMGVSVNAWLAGDVEPYNVAERGSNACGRRIWLYSEKLPRTGKDRENKYRVSEIPLQARHLMAVAFYWREEDDREFDADGDRAVPWIKVVAGDGSWAALPVVLPDHIEDVFDLDDGYDEHGKPVFAAADDPIVVDESDDTVEDDGESDDEEDSETDEEVTEDVEATPRRKRRKGNRSK